MAWLDSYNHMPPVTLPSLPSGTPVAEAASQVREALDLSGDQPIANLTYRLERAGVPVINRNPSLAELPEKHYGYSTRVGHHRERPLTVVKMMDSWERTRWTVGHQIAHLVLHGSRFHPTLKSKPTGLRVNCLPLQRSCAMKFHHSSRSPVYRCQVAVGYLD